MALDLNSLRKATMSLEKSLNVAKPENLENMSEEQQDVIEAGVIQNFEFTYELCWKFMKRWISRNIGATYVDGVTRKELFRLSVENKLIDDVDQWMEYHEARNEIPHTYDEDTAEEIFQVAKTFLTDAKKLLTALEEKND